MSPDAIRLYEQDLLQKADMLAIGLRGLRAADAGRAIELLSVITDRLEGAAAQIKSRVGDDTDIISPSDMPAIKSGMMAAETALMERMSCAVIRSAELRSIVRKASNASAPLP